MNEENPMRSAPPPWEVPRWVHTSISSRTPAEAAEIAAQGELYLEWFDGLDEEPEIPRQPLPLPLDTRVSEHKNEKEDYWRTISDKLNETMFNHELSPDARIHASYLILHHASKERIAGRRRHDLSKWKNEQKRELNHLKRQRQNEGRLSERESRQLDQEHSEKIRQAKRICYGDVRDTEVPFRALKHVRDVMEEKWRKRICQAAKASPQEAKPKLGLYQQCQDDFSSSEEFDEPPQEDTRQVSREVTTGNRRSRSRSRQRENKRRSRSVSRQGTMPEFEESGRSGVQKALNDNRLVINRSQANSKNRNRSRSQRNRRSRSVHPQNERKPEQARPVKERLGKRINTETQVAENEMQYRDVRYKEESSNVKNESYAKVAASSKNKEKTRNGQKALPKHEAKGVKLPAPPKKMQQTLTNTYGRAVVEEKVNPYDWQIDTEKWINVESDIGEIPEWWAQLVPLGMTSDSRRPARRLYAACYIFFQQCRAKVKEPRMPGEIALDLHKYEVGTTRVTLTQKIWQITSAMHFTALFSIKMPQGPPWDIESQTKDNLPGWYYQRASSLKLINGSELPEYLYKPTGVPTNLQYLTNRVKKYNDKDLFRRHGQAIQRKAPHKKDLAVT